MHTCTDSRLSTVAVEEGVSEDRQTDRQEKAEADMVHDHPQRRDPYPPRSGYLVPVVSLALSLPTLVGTLALGGVALYHALTGQALDVSVPPLVQSPLGFSLAVCYLAFGPVLGGILCLTQRTHTEQVYGSALLLGYKMKRLNTLALWSAGLAISVLLLLVVVGLVLRGRT